MIEMLFTPFLQRALLAGILVGTMASLLGVLVILRRSAFFGDAIAHASMAGVAVGILSGSAPLLGATAVGVGIAMSLHVVERRTPLALDTVLGFVLPFFLALGVLLMSLRPGYQPELFNFLFGSILTVSRDTLLVVGLIAALVLAAWWRFRSQLLFAAFDEEAAQLAGIRVGWVLTGYHVLLALVIIASMRTVGVILANALLIIPAATARMLARSLTQMFFLAPLLGIVSVIGGMTLSYTLDLPAGPAIVVLSGSIFLVVAAWSGRQRHRKRSGTSTKNAL